MKKTFSIDDILKPKALKLHPGFITNTSPISSNSHANTADHHITQDKQYGLSIDFHGNRNYDREIIHSRGGLVSVPGQHSFTSVIREHIHRQGGEAPVHNTVHSYSPYRHEALSKEKYNYHIKTPSSGSPTRGLRMCDTFRWEENAFSGREPRSRHDSQESVQHRDQERERQDIESSQESGKENGSPGRSSQPSPAVSTSSSRSASPEGKQDSTSTPPSNQHLTTEHHARSTIEADYLGLPAMPHPTYPAPHHILLRSAVGMTHSLRSDL